MQASSDYHSASPPLVTIPRDYNAAHDLLERNATRAGKVAFMDALSGEQLTYGELTEQSHRFANALRAQGFAPESRVLLAMLDTPQWPVVFVGWVQAGGGQHAADVAGLRVHAARLACAGAHRLPRPAAFV
jgi:benzoate-CoA ligase